MLEFFERSTFDQKKFIIFRLGFEKNVKAFSELYERFGKEEYFRGLSDIYRKGLECREDNITLLNNLKDYGEEQIYYNKILQKIKKLADELGLANSLEISNLFTYLLYNGYLSKNKKNLYQAVGRKYTYGFPQKDIANGIGVCLNHSLYLKDLLRVCGYDSSVLINRINYSTIDSRIAKLERSEKDNGPYDLSVILGREDCQHLFTLVKDDDKYYIYDSTNFAILGLDDINNAKLISGTGTSYIYFLESYFLTLQQKERQMLDKIPYAKDISSPYDRETFGLLANLDKYIFDISGNLIEDFYADVRSDISKMARVKKK